MVRSGPRASRCPRSSKRFVRVGDDGHLSPHSRADRPRACGDPAATDLAPGLGEGVAGHEEHGGGAAHEAGRGHRWRSGRHRSGARVRERRRLGDVARGPRAPRRRRLLVHAQRHPRGQRSTRVPALLHRVPRAAGAHRRGATHRDAATPVDPRPRSWWREVVAAPHEPAGAAAPCRRACAFSLSQPVAEAFGGPGDDGAAQGRSR